MPASVVSGSRGLRKDQGPLPGRLKTMQQETLSSQAIFSKKIQDAGNAEAADRTRHKYAVMAKALLVGYVAGQDIKTQAVRQGFGKNHMWQNDCWRLEAAIVANYAGSCPLVFGGSFTHQPLLVFRIGTTWTVDCTCKLRKLVSKRSCVFFESTPGRNPLARYK